MSSTAQIFEFRTKGDLGPDAPSYVNRPEADAPFHDALLRGEYCYVLNSRQMGKSSLVSKVTSQLRKEGVLCVTLNLQGVVTHDMTSVDFCRRVAQETLSETPLSEKLSFEDWWRARPAPGYEALDDFYKCLLAEFPNQPIVIFIDEIDMLLALNFRDDFLLRLRSYHERRTSNESFRRLTFALIGVASPADLIADPRKSPFNIGRPIPLEGLRYENALPVLGPGLAPKCPDPAVALHEILSWTNGQPHLTQHICELVVTQPDGPPPHQEGAWIEELVRTRVIASPDFRRGSHIGAIQARLLPKAGPNSDPSLAEETRSANVLSLYQKVLEGERIPADGARNQIELRLSGLVREQDGHLQIANRVYAEFFNRAWLDRSLGQLRPYSKELSSWLASGKSEIELLAGAALERARSWSEGKTLTPDDREFLRRSERAEASKAERLRAAIWYRRLAIALGLLLLAAIALAATAWVQAQRAEKQAALATSGRLGMAALLYKEKRLDLAALLSIEGKPASDGFEARNSLLLSLQAEPGLISMLHQSGAVYSIAFSPDGKLLASASGDNTVRLWDVARRQPLGDPLQGHSSVVWSVAFSPDGKLLASASEDKTVRLWDVARRQPLGDPLQGHSGMVYSAAFSPDGKLLASASVDKTVRLWDVARRQPLGDPLQGHSGAVYSVAFSPDGKLLASASEDQTIRLWDVDPTSWVNRLCVIANRNLSLAEWQQYIGGNVPYRPTCPDLPPGVGAPSK